jgi:hypothetical protein
MKTFVTISGGILLVLSCVTASDASPHNDRLRPTRAEVLYNHPTGDLDRSDVVNPALEHSVYQSYKGD